MCLLPQGPVAPSAPGQFFIISASSYIVGLSLCLAAKASLLRQGRYISWDIVFRSPTFPFLGRRTQEHGLPDRQSTDASDRAVDSRVVLVRTNDCLQHFWRRTC
jgi:hypothetical protein